MNDLKKKVLIGVSAVTLFGAGHLTSGASSWANQVIVDGNKKVNTAAYNKKTELLSNLDQKIQEKLAQGMDSKISTREQQAEQELEEFFNQKVSEIDSYGEVAEIEKQLDVNLENTVGRYKEEISQAFGTKF